MGKIDLGREQGVRPTGAAGHGGTNINLGGVISAAGSAGSAVENSLRGIRSVSNSLFGIYSDLAQTRNRQEYLEGQTAMFDISNAENEKLEERMRLGEFDGAGGLELFKREASASQAKINEKFQEWSSKNITQTDTRKALNERLSLDAKKNFAHLSGRFLAYDEKRRFGLMESQCDRAVEDGNMDNLNAAIKAYCGGGKDENGNDIPRYKSQEFEERLRNFYTEKFDNAQLKSVVNSIKLAQSSEEVDGLISKYLQSENYKRLGKFKADYFNIFAMAWRRKIESSEFSARAAKDKNAASDELKGIEADAESSVRDNISIARSVSDLSKYSLNKEGAIKAFDSVLAKSSFSDGEKKSKRIAFLNKLDELEKKQNDAICAKLKSNAVSVLEEAVQNDGLIPQERLGESNVVRFVNETPEGDKRTKDFENRIVFEKKSRFFDLIRKIAKYDFNSDKSGDGLAELALSAQMLGEKDRKEVLNILNRKAKGEKPEKWADADVKLFDEVFDKFCNLKEDKSWWGNDSDPAAFLEMRNRILQAAQVRGLSLYEALDEMKNDPFYKAILQDDSKKRAYEFINRK